MAANMYRVGGMYVNVDLFIQLKPSKFCLRVDNATIFEPLDKKWRDLAVLLSHECVRLE